LGKEYSGVVMTVMKLVNEKLERPEVFLMKKGILISCALKKAYTFVFLLM